MEKGACIMNVNMLKKDIKYLLKNPIFYLGIAIVIYILISTLCPYLNLYKNVRDNSSDVKYGSGELINGYIPTDRSEQEKLVFNRIHESLVNDFDISEKEASEAVEIIKSMDSLEDIQTYLNSQYGMSKGGIANLYEDFSGKYATEKEMKNYLTELFKDSTYTENFSFKYVDYLGVGLVYFSIIVFMLVFMKDMKKDIFSLLHTKPISGISYVITKLFAGLIPIYFFAICTTAIFDCLANVMAGQYGSEKEWLSIWIKLILLILPNIFMVGVFFIFITVVFKSVLPTIPALLVYATYSNMGRTLDDGYTYIPNPLAIIVRFPNDLGNNYIPNGTVINQIILVLLAFLLLVASVRLWEKKRLFN